jgi:hypothetical protein
MVEDVVDEELRVAVKEFIGYGVLVVEGEVV